MQKPGRLFAPFTPSVHPSNPDTKRQIPPYFLQSIPLLHPRFYSTFLTCTSITASWPLTSLPISNPFTTLPEDTSDNSTFQIKILYGLVIFSIKFELAVWVIQDSSWSDFCLLQTHLYHQFSHSIHIYGEWNMCQALSAPASLSYTLHFTLLLQPCRMPLKSPVCHIFSNTAYLLLLLHYFSLLTPTYTSFYFVLYFWINCDTFFSKNHSPTPYAGWVTDISS